MRSIDRARALALLEIKFDLSELARGLACANIELRDLRALLKQIQKDRDELLSFALRTA